MNIKDVAKKTVKIKHGSQKGKASLNPVQKSKDNMVGEGKNENNNS